MRFCLMLTVSFIVANAAAQEVAFTIAEKDLIPEGICADPLNGDLYISSINKKKIIRLSNGKVTDFITSGQDDFMGGVGLHIDSAQRILWACSGNTKGDTYRRAIHAYDITSGKLLKKITYPADTAKHFFNDLAISKSGGIYITDTYNHSLWEWSLSAESPAQTNPGPSEFTLDGNTDYPNGIVVSPDDRFLFIATARGLQRVNVNNHQVEILPMPGGVENFSGLDGLGFYGNSIYAVQNGPKENKEMKILRYVLSDDFDRITQVETIDKGNQYFEVPTTLAIFKDELFVIANSQLHNFDFKTFSVKDQTKLNNVIILKYKLPKP